jgi:hypothetical protein
MRENLDFFWPSEKQRQKGSENSKENQLTDLHGRDVALSPPTELPDEFSRRRNPDSEKKVPPDGGTLSAIPLMQYDLEFVPHA